VTGIEYASHEWMMNPGAVLSLNCHELRECGCIRVRSYLPTLDDTDIWFLLQFLARYIDSVWRHCLVSV
jgi:hypothetical protein